MIKKKISIIMPMYNHEKFVKKAILSVLNQTHKNLELIIIDDGSTDNSRNIVKKIKDTRIKYFYQKNKGVKKLNQTINKGFHKSSGEFLTMMPSDDKWPKNRIALQLKHFNDNSISLVFGKMKIIDDNDKVIKQVVPPIDIKNFNKFSKYKKLSLYLMNNYIPQPTVLIRKSRLKEIGGYIQKHYMYAEDYPTQLNLLKKGDIKYINCSFAYYRFHSGQMTKKHTEKMVTSDIRYIKNFYKELPKTIKDKIISKDIIFNYLKKKVHDSYFDIGRTYLFLKKKKIALNFFLSSIKMSKFSIKIKSLIGITCLIFNINMEKLIKIYKY
jgi:glycosyltransferase involved in cell wall biosynthesis